MVRGLRAPGHPPITLNGRFHSEPESGTSQGLQPGRPPTPFSSTDWFSGLSRPSTSRLPPPSRPLRCPFLWGPHTEQDADFSTAPALCLQNKSPTPFLWLLAHWRKGGVSPHGGLSGLYCSVVSGLLLAGALCSLGEWRFSGLPSPTAPALHSAPRPPSLPAAASQSGASCFARSP